MTTDVQKRMPWEDDAEELTEAEVKEQLARILAIGALQAARRRAAETRGVGRAKGGDSQALKQHQHSNLRRGERQ